MTQNKLTIVGMTDADFQDERMNHEAFEKFKSANPNVCMAKIRGTDFSFFFVPPDIMNKFIA